MTDNKPFAQQTQEERTQGLRVIVDSFVGESPLVREMVYWLCTRPPAPEDQVDDRASWKARHPNPHRALKLELARQVRERWPDAADEDVERTIRVFQETVEDWVLGFEVSDDASPH